MLPTDILTQPFLDYMIRMAFYSGLTLGVGLGLIVGFIVRPYLTPIYPTTITIINEEKEDGNNQ